VITAVMLVPILASVGLAVDYIRASHARTTLFGAADAAAAGAVSQASPTYKHGGTFSGDWTREDAEQDARNLFQANLVNNVGFRVEDLKADVTQTGRKIVSKVDFIVKVPTTFMRLFGQPDVTITGSAVAVVDTAPFIDFYLLLDNSPSMGLGATTADIANLERNTPDNCAFACHTTNQPTKNYYALAKTLGVTMRIDVVRQATQNLFDKAAEMRVHDEQFRMSVNTFGPAAETRKLTEVVALSSDLAAGKTQAGAVDLMTIPHQNYDHDQQTEFDKVFAALNAKIGTPGSGASPASREKIVFFVSDGVADQEKADCTKPKTGKRCQEPIDTRLCKTLKDRGIIVAVLYTTYQPVNEGWYNTWIHPFQPQVATRMMECATPGYFFEVSPSEGIVEAMQALFIKVLGNPRITG
jgi:hypothetical protein